VSQAQVPLQTRQALVGQLRRVTLELREQLQGQCQLQPELLSQNQKLLHGAEHMLSNGQIEAQLKQPLADAYVQLLTLYAPDSFPKLIAKARFYFNTRDDLVAVHILHAYHSAPAPFKHKADFYHQALLLLLELLFEKARALCSGRAADRNK
jgi:hypothetical protein